MVSMDRNKWLWVFVVFSILNLIVVAISIYNVLEIELLYKNIIHAVFSILALYGLVMAFLAKK